MTLLAETLLAGTLLAGTLLAGTLLLGACRDPVDPPPLPAPQDLPRWSTAPYVRWAGPADDLRGPLLLIVDQPGGPLDRIAADSDVTTFVNDRFTPIFLIPSVAPELPAPSLQIIDEAGCWLAEPQQPETVSALIALLNTTMTRRASGATAQPRPTPPATWGIDLPAGYPLQRPCVSP